MGKKIFTFLSKPVALVYFDDYPESKLLVSSRNICCECSLQTSPSDNADIPISYVGHCVSLETLEVFILDQKIAF